VLPHRWHAGSATELALAELEAEDGVEVTLPDAYVLTDEGDTYAGLSYGLISSDQNISCPGGASCFR